MSNSIGWVNRMTGVKYINIASQTRPRGKNVPWCMQCSRETQSVETKERCVETRIENTTQTWTGIYHAEHTFYYRKDYYVPNASDRYATVKLYEPHEEMQFRLDIDGCARKIQRCYRAYRLAKFLKESAAIYRTMVQDCQKYKQEKLQMQKKRRLEELDRLTYPTSRADFDALFNLVDIWKRTVNERNAKLFSGGAKRAVDRMLVDETVQVLRDIDRKKQVIKADFEKRRSVKFLTHRCKSIKWRGYKGKTIEMVTTRTQEARELKRIYDNLTRTNTSVEERIEMLIVLKSSLRYHNCVDVSELHSVIDQEIVLLSRGIKNVFHHLRQRLGGTFLTFVRNSGNCGCKDASDVQKKDSITWSEPIETSKRLFCTKCRRLLHINRFSLEEHMKKLSFCTACKKLVEGRNPRVNTPLFTFLLDNIRVDEIKRNGISRLSFVMQEDEIYYLTNVIWHGRSIVSEIDDLYRLRLPRFIVDEEWAPWNCILLTEEEAEVHRAIKDIRTIYAQALLDKIFLAHAQAKNHFRKRRVAESQFRQTSNANLVASEIFCVNPGILYDHNPEQVNV